MASFISSIKRKLASILPFPRLNNDHIVAATEIAPSDDDDDGDRPRKRQRRNGYLPLHRHASTASSSSSSSFSAAPHLLVESTRSIPPDFKGRSGHECPPPPATSTSPPSSASPLLRLLPNDALSHCLSYLNTPSDRFGLQVSCRTFRRLSDEEGMLASLELGGCYDRASASASASGGHSRFEDLGDDDDDDDEGEGEDDDDDAAARRGGGAAVVAVAGGLLLPPPRPLPPTTNARPPRRRRAADGGIILERDTSVTAIARLVKFAAAGNMQAIYMIAMISCYCHENLPEGIALLRHAASRDHLPSAYALAIVLRDCRRDESDRCLARASYLGHAPSWQEILTAVEMRARFGSDVDARGLHRYLDPPCLSDLLGRHYLGSVASRGTPPGVARQIRIERTRAESVQDEDVQLLQAGQVLQ
ncbi:hypothetical protein ACHAW5_005023 [Stephanodiscus triporus]|uniref:F-box domain-containing protein n=1 Tax=Stephanodiscus triporus TaxID=2934178 RepID=A0ABD3Q9J0_9STRA